MSGRPEVLVAIDYDRRGDEPLWAVLDELDNAGALLAHDVEQMPHPTRPDADPLTVHRVSFDARRYRNTEVHGLGYRAGYVVHIA